MEWTKVSDKLPEKAGWYKAWVVNHDDGSEFMVKKIWYYMSHHGPVWGDKPRKNLEVLEWTTIT